MSFSKEQNDHLSKLNTRLMNHPIYKDIRTIEDLKIFMSYHVFAVWDFMSLLKGLQRKITCVEVPWKPSPYPKEIVRFVNEIVLGEESDEDGLGGFCDHFSLYLRSMEEIGADTQKILNFINNAEVRKIPMEVFKFTKYNLDLVAEDCPHKLASAFFYGREDIIPNMFDSLVKGINDLKDQAPRLYYYLKRHIELDGDSHGPLAQKALSSLCEDLPKKWDEAYEVAFQSLKLRLKLWDGAHREIKSSKRTLTDMDT